MACEHWPGDIDRGLRASARRHWPTTCSINQGLNASAERHRRRPMTGNISQGMHTSDVECVHLANDVSQRHAALAKACMHQPWPCTHRLGEINQGLCASAGRYQSWLTRYRPTVGNINQGLHASDVSCAYRATNVGQWQAALTKACTHQPWRVHINLATSASANGR
ncbi:hypothetical protein H5410_014684 [Solanum commersonii]|uniref:Uncharacterized protein n=1 Tax=Solanum commersonii TaxID=4109 RepID=A0A9J5ZS51_SOLCO|nr:hypothetical protein H5410_014684 [Solanum commersonii]